MELLGAKLQYEAAMKYYKGDPKHGYGRNRKKAFFLFKEAAETGLVEAMVKLSHMYANGEGCRRNEKESHKWIEKAANKGNAEAQYQMGLYYMQKNDCHQTCEWLEKAAEQRHEKAMYALGEYYTLHFDNFERAIYLLSQPIFNNHPDAIYLLAQAYEKQEKAQKATFEIGNIYDDLGELINPEVDEFECWKDTINNYQPSEKVIRLYQKALQLCEQKASFGSWQCALKVANIYFFGIGTEVNYQKAFDYYNRLAHQPKGMESGECNDFYRIHAVLNLAKMYEQGIGCKQDIDKCNQLIKDNEIDEEWFKNYIIN